MGNRRERGTGLNACADVPPRTHPRGGENLLCAASRRPNKRLRAPHTRRGQRIGAPRGARWTGTLGQPVPQNRPAGGKVLTLDACRGTLCTPDRLRTLEQVTGWNP